MKVYQPIGIFDSGIGGLTVAKAVSEILSNEDIVYFGDTAHLPYGDKSTAAIQAYSIKISDFLLSKGCKVILIACNSASSAAYELVKDYVGQKALVIDVISPTVNYVASAYSGKRVGLIGTKQTVLSQVYAQKTAKLAPNLELKSLATPLLAPMIEEGFFNNTISEQVIASYLSDPALQNIQALILACTHYPLIKNQIAQFFNPPIDIIDGAFLVANALRQALHEKQIHRAVHTQSNAKHTFYVSDYTQSFEESTHIFFGKKVHLEKCNLWG